MWRFLVLLALTGCATVDRPVITACLPMVEYSTDEQSRAASELDALPHGSVIGRFVVDYGAMRAANRACLAK